LSHACSPCCSGYFGDRILLFAQAGLDHNPPILLFLPSLGWQLWTTMPFFFCWDGISQNFLPRLAWNHSPPNLNLISVWCHRHEPPLCCLANNCFEWMNGWRSPVVNSVYDFCIALPVGSRKFFRMVGIFKWK
jgi:hypothetical protein